MVKMADVARHAGVSIKTVSRVLNNEPHVQEKLIARVRKSVEELGYVPSASARSLRSRRSYRIHLLCESTRNSFANVLQFGAILACQRNGYELVLNLLDTDRGKGDDEFDDWISDMSKRGKPDGVILIPPYSTNPLLVKKLVDSGLSVVGVGSTSVNKKQLGVLIDDCAAAREMVSYLIELGHKRIGFVKGNENQFATADRFRGYRQALDAYGIVFEPDLVVDGTFRFESGLSAGEALLMRPDPPTAIMASNDDMAAGVLVTAYRLKISVPEQLSIAGFDDTDIAQRFWPGLTTIHQPLEQLGYKAVELIVKNSPGSQETNSSMNYFLDHELIERNSTGAPLSE